MCQFYAVLFQICRFGVVVIKDRLAVDLQVGNKTRICFLFLKSLRWVDDDETVAGSKDEFARWGDGRSVLAV